MPNFEKLLEKAKKNRTETKDVEFKQEFDISSTHDFVELTKDFVAMANSGGGIILIGVDNNCTPSGFYVTDVLNIDTADITKKIKRFIGSEKIDFDIYETTIDEEIIAVINVYPVDYPIIFEIEGSYPHGIKGTKIAFHKGTLYFRNTGESETGNFNDLRKFVEDKIDKIRRDWLDGIKKVTTAPIGSIVSVHQKDKEILIPETIDRSIMEVQISNDPKAKEVKGVNTNLTHPYRLREFTKKMNKKLGGIPKVKENTIKKILDLYKLKNDLSFYFSPLHSSPQYSEKFFNFILERHEKDKTFFSTAIRLHKTTDWWN